MTAEARTKPRNTLVVLCSCGGWVMMAALGYDGDADHFKEAGELAAMGFTVRTPVPSEEAREIPGCRYRGRCTTGGSITEGEMEERGQLSILP